MSNTLTLKAQIKRISFPDNQKWSRELVFIALQFCDQNSGTGPGPGRETTRYPERITFQGTGALNAFFPLLIGLNAYTGYSASPKTF